MSAPRHSSLRRYATNIVTALVVLLVVATGLSLIETDEWWIRVFDFPRLQIAVALALLLCVFVMLAVRHGLLFYGVLTAGLLSFVWQAYLIAPYTLVWPDQMQAALSCSADEQVSLFMANVLQENDDYDAVRAAIADADADIVLLTEIDERWEAELGAQLESYPGQLSAPLSNTYGMGFYSRLPLREGEVRYILEDDIPSVKAEIDLPGGTSFAFWGVHPSPPRPGDDTDERDAELLIVADEASEATLSVIVGGDLNDVAWSSTTTLFSEISQLLDPRIGRGLYATFNADWPLLKWPLDHLFASEEWLLVEFARLQHVGSDHFPVRAVLCHRPAAAGSQEPNRPEAGDEDEAREHIEEGREAATEEEGQ